MKTYQVKQKTIYTTTTANSYGGSDLLKQTTKLRKNKKKKDCR